MPELLVTGQKFPCPDHDDAFVAAVAESTANIARFVTRAVVPRLPGLRRRDDLAVLDLGCGEGTALLALAEAYPRGRLVGVEVEPRSVARARERIAEAGLADRAEVRLGDVADAELGGAFDLVTLIQVLHELEPEGRPDVLARAHQALRPGGFLLIVDEPYPNQVSDYPEAPMSVLTQLVESFWGNTLLSMDEQRGMVEGAGFAVLSQMVPPPGLICLTTAKRA